MRLKNINIFLTVLILAFQCILIFPWTFQIIKSNGGAEGWGFFFLPLNFSLHFLMLSSLTVFFTDKHEKLAKRLFSIMTTIAALLTIISFVYGVLFVTLITFALFITVSLVVFKKLKLGYGTLIINLILLASMTYWATEFE